MNGFKVFCIILIVLGVGIFGFGFVRYQQEIGVIQTPTLADPMVFDIADMTTAEEELVVENPDAVPNGELTSTNGDVVENSEVDSESEQQNQTESTTEESVETVNAENTEVESHE